MTFLYLLKVRTLIGCLPDVDLNDFLVKALFEGGFLKTLFSVLFVVFRAIKCEIEKEELGEEKARKCVSLTHTVPLSYRFI